MSEDDQCIICFEDFYKYDVAVLSCNHKFHYKCIKQWMNKKNNFIKICPLCNKDGEIINILDGEEKEEPENLSPISLSQTPDLLENLPQPRSTVYVYEVRREPEYEYICCNIL